jgi:hypothetical protein
VEDQHKFIVRPCVTKCVFKFAVVRERNCNLVQQITLQAVLTVFSGNLRPQKSPRFLRAAGFAKDQVLYA